LGILNLAESQQFTTDGYDTMSQPETIPAPLAEANCQIIFARLGRPTDGGYFTMLNPTGSYTELFTGSN